MSTLASPDYVVATGASAAALKADVEAKALTGYAAIGGVNVNGGVFYQAMMKGEAGSFTSIYAINGVTSGVAGSGSFRIATDQTLNFQAGYRFTVINSTGNDGVYTVKNGGSTFGGGNTTIPVNQAVLSAVADGTIEAYAPTQY